MSSYTLAFASPPPEPRPGSASETSPPVHPAPFLFCIDLARLRINDDYLSLLSLIIDGGLLDISVLGLYRRGCVRRALFSFWRDEIIASPARWEVCALWVFRATGG